MKCDECRDGLSAYHDGEAGPRAEAIRAHVDGCEACRGILERHRLVSEELRGVEAPKIRFKSRTSGRAFAAAAAILAAVLWAGVFLWTSKAHPARLSDLAGDLPDTERRILYGKPPTDDEWMAIIVSGGKPR